MLLHWLLAVAIAGLFAVAIAGLFAVGLYMADLPFSPLRLKLFNWHKWAGMTFLALTVLRLLWRATHHLLYLLFFAVPLIGWAYTSAAGLHVAAALKHQVLDRDGLLQRMLPGRS